MGAQLMAIVAEGHRQRYYLPPVDEHEHAADVSIPENAPESDLPEQALGFRVQGYGMRTWADLFTSRQLTALTTLSDLVREVRALVVHHAVGQGLPPDDAASYGSAIAVYLGIVVSRLSDYASTITTWASNPQMEILRSTFARQALPMTWDFAESNIFGPSSGTIDIMINAVYRAINLLPAKASSAYVEQCDAAKLDLTRNYVIATDPPYYDNVGYADLSDYFYVWLRRSLGDVLSELMGTVLTPKAAELVADPFRHGDKKQAEQFFEDGFEQVFTQIRAGTSGAFPISIFYAFKQAETDGEDRHASTGWETLLQGMLKTGWAVTATWPVSTERGGRTRDIGSNALASSIVLACRPRGRVEDVVDRRGLIAALRTELPSALRKLQHGSIAPVDLAQAAIGPGMAIFSRYARVNEPDGQAMRVRTALVLINQLLDEVLSEQEGDFSKDTRWCVEWFKSYGFDDGPFGIAETLSKAKNTGVDVLERAGVLRSRAGKVRLSSVRDIPENYDPAADDRVSEWEIALHLAKRLHEQGGDDAARLMAAAQDKVDLGAVKELAYLLFSIAEKKGWSDTAQLFNGLGTSWSDLAGAASSTAMASPAHVQGQLDLDTDDE